MNTNRARENFVIHVMNSGFTLAADSFSRFIGREVRLASSNSVLVRHDDDFSYISDEDGELYVLVTRIIGNLYGKSYLIFSKQECDDIFKMAGKYTTPQLKEAMLLEIDNIISASVISKLSDALKLNIYGDVPELMRMHSLDLQEFFSDDVTNHDPFSVIFTNTTFRFNHNREIHPQFIWKLSAKIFEQIPTEKLTMK